MRNILIIFSLLFISNISNAQLVVPIDEVNDYIDIYGILPKDKYFKDVNGILDKYEGAWEGIHDNKTYYFEITKLIEEPSRFNPLTLRDDLLIKFKIVDNSTNTTLYDTYNLSSDLLIKRSSFREITENKQVMTYVGGDKGKVNCGDIGDIYLEPFALNTKLKVYVEPDSIVFYVEDGQPHPCPDGRILPPFPDNENDALILTKLTSQPSLGN